MNSRFATRMGQVKKSFIREILKVTENPQIISFAGGLPNPETFPVEEIKNACIKVLDTDGKTALQYSTTEGYLPLREFIAQRYFQRKNFKISPDNIQITNGSQQALDLIGKAFLNKGDHVIIEKPAYLGAIQALSIYEPVFHTVTLNEDGIDAAMLKDTLDKYPVKLFYSVPNFQNPSGISYSEEKRKQIAEILKNYDTIFIEDDPYGELRFSGTDKSSLKSLKADNIILLGTFSKTVAPAFRLGWLCADSDIMEKIIIAKQAADLHTNYFSQRVVHQHLIDNPLDEHIIRISKLYKAQCEAMISAIKKYFPKEVNYTRPEGGMFLWATLPGNICALKLFDIAIEEKVAFVPGDPFYIDEDNVNTLRLNYSCENKKTIEEGIKRLGKAIKKMINKN
jgi:2-aminoadipate transaminase